MNWMEIIGLFIAFISVLTGIFMPILLSMSKKNARQTDISLKVLSQGQTKTFDILNEMKLSLNDVENKVRENHSNHKELKGFMGAKIENVEKRLNFQSDKIYKNERRIVIMENNYEKCPAKIKKS